MEKIKCEICGAAKSEILLTAGDRMQKTSGKFNLVRCLVCGQIYINPRPNYQEINKYYKEDYKPFAQNKNKLVELYYSYIFRKELKKYKQLLPRKATVLEIGCATGNFLAYLRDAGHWDVEGIEISRYAAEKATEKHKLRVKVANLNDCVLETGRYDLIIMKYVLEHLHHPCAALGKVSQALKKDGVLVLWLPNYDGAPRKFFGKYWYSLDIPRHLFNFTPELITKILDANDFTVQKIEHDLAPNDLIASLRYFLEEKTGWHFGWLNFSNSLLLLLFYPFSLLTALFHQSGRIRVTATKR